MNLPLISIIIPCYNHGLYIREALESIEKAKDKYPVEVIIVNDGSTDEYTLQVFKELEQEGYFVLHQNNGGLGNARNNGIRLAKGKYILPLDSDNKVLSPYLNEAINMLERNENIDIVYGNVRKFGETEEDSIIGEFNIQRLMIGNYIDACAIYRKSTWELIRGYDEKMPFNGIEDWDFWLRAAFKKCHFFYLKKCCFEYRVMSDSMIRQLGENRSKELVHYIRSKYAKEYYDCFNYFYHKYYYFVEIPLYKSIPKIILYKLGLYKYRSID